MPETPPPMDGAGAKEERGPDRVRFFRSSFFFENSLLPSLE